MAALLLTYILSWIFVVSLKQQSTGIDIYLSTLIHYTDSWVTSIFPLTIQCSMLSRESANTNYWYIVWPYFSYRCSNTWSSLYLSSIHFLDHEGGNDKNQPDEINIDQTEAKNKNQPEANNKDQTEANNKDQTEANNKVDTEELEQNTEKQIIKTIEK